MTFLTEGKIGLASYHWLLSLQLDIQPYAQAIIKIEEDLELFKISVEQKLSGYLPSSPNISNHTPFEATVLSLAHVIGSELTKFGDDVTALKTVYHSIQVAFLQPGSPNSVTSKQKRKINNWEEATSRLRAAPVNATTAKMKRQMIRTIGKAKRQEIRLNKRQKTRETGDSIRIMDPPDRRDIDHNKQRRTKRSAILGFLSPVLSALFGLPSEGSWKMAQRNLKRLHDTNQALQEALGQTLQIVNITQSNIITNKQAIKELRDGLTKARSELNVILKQITDRINENFQLTTLVEKIQALFHVTASSLRVSLHQLSLLKTDLELARQGNLAATLVPVTQFRTILRGIQASLPKDTYLPAGLDHLVWYYSNLAVHILMDSQKINLVMDIPLKNLENEYDLYQMIQVPGSIKNPGNRPSVRYFQWDVPHRYIAISNGKEHYVKLTTAEAGLCKQLYCKPTVAFLSFTYAESCILALFKNNTKSVWEQCNINNYKMSKTPRIIWLFGNTWMAENATGEPYDVICGSILNPTTEIRSYQITKVIQKITLPSDCWLRSHLFVTPRMITRTEQIEIIPVLDFSNLTFTELNVPAGVRQAPWHIGPGDLAPDRQWIRVDTDVEGVLNKLKFADRNGKKFEVSKANGILSWSEILLLALVGLLLLTALIIGCCHYFRCRLMMNMLPLNQNVNPLLVSRSRYNDMKPHNEIEMEVFEPLNSAAEGISVSPSSIKYRPRQPLPSECSSMVNDRRANLSDLGHITHGKRPTCAPNIPAHEHQASSLSVNCTGVALKAGQTAKRARHNTEESDTPRTGPKIPKVSYTRVSAAPLVDAEPASPTGTAFSGRRDPSVRVSPYYIAMRGDDDCLQPRAT